MSPTADIRAARRRGMSLIELIVAMAIFAAIMSSVMIMFNSVTNTVRRSYRTMDMMERSRGALLAVEEDVKTSFTALAAGADFHFYGEPYGFIMVGIAPNARLGRLTYGVYRDTSRSDFEPAAKRGERVTLPRSADDMLQRFPGIAAYYPAVEGSLIDVEVEVVYGTLVRVYEEGIESVEQFPRLNREIVKYKFALGAQYPAMLENRPADSYFPWLSRIFIWPNLDAASVPWYVREKIETVEKCHYWLQLIQGPRPAGMAAITPWNPMNLWSDWEFQNQNVFWQDPIVDGGYNPNGPPVVWDHVMAEDFVYATYLLDPATGNRIVAPHAVTGEDVFIPVLEPTDRPPYVFEYQVESGMTSPLFNTLFNLDHDGAFKTLTETLRTSPINADIDGPIGAMAETRQFYDMGSPLQSRLPSAFTINLLVLNPPVVQGAPPDFIQFTQTIHLPAGFLRRSRAQF